MDSARAGNITSMIVNGKSSVSLYPFPDEAKQKTPSQRLRATIYRVWETSKERSEGVASEAFYETRMSEIIEEEARKIGPPPPDSPRSRPNSLPTQYGKR